MAAGALHHLGVYMGEVTGVAYEERELSGAVESRDVTAVREIVADRDRRHRVWGWKRPSAFKHLDLVDAELTDPYYLLVFRDVFGLGQRRDLSMPGRFDLFQTMRNALAVYRTMVDFAEQTGQPCLLLSYEKCLHRPRLAVDAMAEFLGLSATGEAVSFIRRDPADYLEGSHVRPRSG